MKKYKKILVIMSILFVLLISINGCQSKPVDKPTGESYPIKTAPVKKQEFSIPVYTCGRLSPKTVVKLSFKVGGLIESVYAEEGDSVQKGQLLASLNLSEINAWFLQAKNGWLKAQRDLKRVENLYKDRAATLEQLENAKTAFEVAKSDLKIASFNLEYSKIKAPSKGKILKRLSEKGEMIGVGSPLFLFGSTETQWIVKAGISEGDIVRIALEDPAIIQFDAYPGKEFPAAVTEVSESIDPSTGTFELEVAVDDLGLKLVSGFVGKVEISPSLKDFFFVVPVDSLVEGKGSEGVLYTVKNNKAKKIKVKIAHIFPDTLAVISGLEGINQVVTWGAAYLTDGSPVKVIQ